MLCNQLAFAKACLYEFTEQRSCFVWTALEFRMKLTSNHPSVFLDFHNLYKIAFRIYSGNYKTRLFQMIREAAKLIQGGGGGQPHYAQAGGKNKDGLSAAVDKVVELAQL